MPAFLPVLLGTIREGNATRPVAEFVRERIDARGDATSALFDPAELPFGDLERRVWEMDPQPDQVERFVEEMGRADGFVFATPEYNHGYPGALKNVIDHLYNSWNRKPFGLVTTGGSTGGVRAEEQLRSVITGGLGGVVVPRAVNVTRVRDTFGEEGPAEDVETWTERVDRLAEELVAYAKGMAVVREELGD